MVKCWLTKEWFDVFALLQENFCRIAVSAQIQIIMYINNFKCPHNFCVDFGKFEFSGSHVGWSSSSSSVGSNSSCRWCKLFFLTNSARFYGNLSVLLFFVQIIKTIFAWHFDGDLSKSPPTTSNQTNLSYVSLQPRLNSD